MSTILTPQARCVYIAGPMADREDHGFPAFEEAAADLKEEGYIVLSPHRDCPPDVLEWAISLGAAFKETQQYRDFLRKDLCEMLVCERVYLLPDWQLSNGARMEAFVAHQLGIPMFRYPERDRAVLYFPPFDIAAQYISVSDGYVARPSA